MFDSIVVSRGKKKKLKSKNTDYGEGTRPLCYRIIIALLYYVLKFGIRALPLPVISIRTDVY